MKTQNKKTQFVAKTRNTKIGIIEKKYNVDLGVPSDMKLGDYLEKKGYKSLSEMLSK